MSAPGQASLSLPLAQESFLDMPSMSLRHTWLLPLIVFAAAAGLIFVPLTMTLVAGIADEHSGVASSMFNAGQQIGGQPARARAHLDERNAELLFVLRQHRIAGGQLFDIAFYNHLETRDGSVIGPAVSQAAEILAPYLERALKDLLRECLCHIGVDEAGGYSIHKHAAPAEHGRRTVAVSRDGGVSVISRRGAAADPRRDGAALAIRRGS